MRSIGGPRPGGSTECVFPCNLISGNRTAAVDQADTVQGNFIGTDLEGTKAIPNAGGNKGETPAAVDRIAVLGGPSRALAGVCDKACNLISGNDGFGVLVQSGSKLAPNLDTVADYVRYALTGLRYVYVTSNDHFVSEGNVIGRSATNGALPNRRGGIAASHVKADTITIGGEDDKGNLIADNLGPAVTVAKLSAGSTLADGDAGPIIQGNTITGNKGGIDIPGAVTAPEAPTGLAVRRVPYTTVTLSGRLPKFFKGVASARTVEVFGSVACEPGPQGAIPLGTFKLGSSSPSFTVTVAGVAKALSFFTVTQTYDGTTSTFSNCVSH